MSIDSIPQNINIELNIVADIQINTNFTAESKVGDVNYIHKKKEYKNIYFFTNTTDNPLSTQISLRGQFDKIEIWNPHTGDITKLSDVKRLKTQDGELRAEMKISVTAVPSVFIIGESK